MGCIMMNNRRNGLLLNRFVLLCSILLLSLSALAQSNTDRASSINPAQIWSAWGGEMHFEVFQGVLDDIELGVVSNLNRANQGQFDFSVENLGSLEFYAPDGAFSHFVDGRLTVRSDLAIMTGIQPVEVGVMHVRGIQSGRLPGLAFYDVSGNEMFIADYIQVEVEAGQQELVLGNMDFKIGRDLAGMLNRPYLEGQVFGILNMTLNLNVPVGALTATRGGACDGRPVWPGVGGAQADVGIISMGNVSDFGTFSSGGETFDIIAPGATLKNLQGLDGADVPWYSKFSGEFPPYNNDQHPYLIWNLYRIDNDVMLQIGRSAAKHAFLTLNFNCTINCGDGGIPDADGHILWPGCEDVYGSGTNNSSGALGPRFEINPNTGIFVSTGSFFDPGSTGSQTNSSTGTGENRMNVMRSDLQVPGAEYFVETWYVIREDVNIFNTMSTQRLAGTLNGDNWNFAETEFTVGPMIDRWVPPGTNPNTGSQNVLFADPGRNGHFKLAVKSVDLGGGQFQWTYMLANYDVDIGISELGFNVPAGRMNNTSFHDVDQDDTNDWTLGAGPDFSIQAGSGDEMPWGNSYTISFIAGPPTSGQATIRFGDISSTDTVNLNILVPELAEEFLTDGFEN